MIKKIKFFIRIGGVPCRTLEDLQNSFYLQDVVALHRGGVLRRWLVSNDYEGLAEKVAHLPADWEDERLSRELVSILCPDYPEDSISDALHYFYFNEKQRERDASAAEAKENWKNLAVDYHSGYADTLLKISSNRDDFNYICLSAIDLVDNYWGLVESNVNFFCNTMMNNAPCIFFPLLAMGKFRTKKDTDRITRERLAIHIKDAFKSYDTDNCSWYKSISMSLCDNIIPDNSFCVVNKTIDSWDDIVQDGSHKIMAIYTSGRTASVRSTRTRDELQFDDIYKKFPIFNGLDYKDHGSNPLFAYIDFPESIRKRCSIYQSPENTANEQNELLDTVGEDASLAFFKESPIYMSIIGASGGTSFNFGNIIKINSKPFSALGGVKSE